MVQRVVIAGLLGLLPVLWTGCDKAASEQAGAAKPSSIQAAAPSESPAAPLAEAGEITTKTKDITVEITGMT
jgi:hypothetical protein